MKDINALTQVPAILAGFYPDLAEFKAEMQTFIENHIRTDELVVKMFDKMTTAEAEEVKDQIRDIGDKMNKLMVARMGPATESVQAMIVVMAFGSFMHEYSPPSKVTLEQSVMLKRTGVLGEILRSKPTSAASA